MDQLSADFAKRGMFAPIKVRQDIRPLKIDYVLVDGFYRLEAMKVLGQTHIQVRIINP